MNRLTKRIDNGIIVTCGFFNSFYWQGAPFYEAFDKLAHYEDLEEAGRLIELPCAVGDTVWHVAEIYYEDGKRYEIYADRFEVCDLPFYGNMMFLTKEEAEVKLAELKGENHV